MILLVKKTLHLNRSNNVLIDRVFKVMKGVESNPVCSTCTLAGLHLCLQLKQLQLFGLQLLRQQPLTFTFLFFLREKGGATVRPRGIQTKGVSAFPPMHHTLSLRLSLCCICVVPSWAWWFHPSFETFFTAELVTKTHIHYPYNYTLFATYFVVLWSVCQNVVNFRKIQTNENTHQFV